MITNVSLTYTQPFRCKCICNDLVIGESFDQTHHYFEIPTLPQKVVLEFEPFKIRPDLRLNKILVDTGVSKVDVYDHKYEMSLQSDWLSMYTQSILDSKIDYLKQQNLSKNVTPEQENIFFESYNLAQHEKSFAYYDKELQQILDNLK